MVSPASASVLLERGIVQSRLYARAKAGMMIVSPD